MAKKWLRMITDPNIRDDFNRYLIIEKIGDEIFEEGEGEEFPRPFNPPQYEYVTYMIHQERDNSGTGFPVGDWWTRDEFKVYRHLIVGHYGEAEDTDGQKLHGWIGDELIIYAESPKFLQWEEVDMPTAFENADPKVAALVVRDTTKEQPHENQPAPR